MSFMRWWWEDFKAWRRGERRVAPRGTIGRVYARKDGVPVPPGTAFPTKGRGRLVVRAKVIRADGTVEDKGIVSEGRLE